LIIAFNNVTINPILAAAAGTILWTVLFYFSIKIFYIRATSIAAAATTAATAAAAVD
jgi:hypothetical protein